MCSDKLSNYKHNASIPIQNSLFIRVDYRNKNGLSKVKKYFDSEFYQSESNESISFRKFAKVSFWVIAETSLLQLDDCESKLSSQMLKRSNLKVKLTFSAFDLKNFAHESLLS